MSRIVYDVPVVTQAQNPICWVACMAMVESYHSRSSIGVGRFANGFDPSNSSIPNLYEGDLNDYCSALARYGFVSVGIQPDEESLVAVLQHCGPVILSHYCQNFPYGPGRDAITDPNAAHAVVITGIDTSISGGLCWMNNPWGDKDQPITVRDVLDAVMKMQSPMKGNHRCIAYRG